MVSFSLKIAAKASKRVIAAFKKENVFNSNTFKEILDPKWGEETKAIYAKSRTTGKPVKVFVERETTSFNGTKNFNYSIYDKSGKEIGTKSFGIKQNSEGTDMRWGVMENTAGDIGGVGVIEDAIQIETAIKNGIKVVPRESAAKATLYHTKMGFLPTPDLVEVKNMNDIVDLLQELIKNSPDIKIGHYKPIIIKKNGKYYLDVNTTQAQACVREIKSRLAKDGGYRLENLNAVGTDLELSGDELKVWKKKLAKKSLLDRIG